jgi:NhaP-type Na+/H+ or K+/H+ antiporter
MTLFKVNFYTEDLTKHFVNFFMLFLLPPIIFESGYNMKKKPFFRNFGTIMLFSFLGTFIAIFISSFIIWALSKSPFGPVLSLKESFAFGSLISATDPVSVLALFGEMNADNNLYSIVFGESIFNDAITIVMYKTILKLEPNSDQMGMEIIFAICSFMVIFIGSFVIGASSALFVAYILKRQSLNLDARLSSMDQYHQ